MTPDAPKKYRVYFDQVNQTRYDITAKTPEEAIAQAKRHWIQDYGRPTGTHVEGGEDATD